MNWTPDQWKNVVFSDETMIVLGNDQKLHILKNSDEKCAPHLVCHEEHKRIPVISWVCVTSKGVGVLFPICGRIDSQKYIEILENYIKHSISWYFGEDAITFWQDNAPCYVSRMILVPRRKRYFHDGMDGPEPCLQYDRKYMAFHNMKITFRCVQKLKVK